MHTTTHCKTCAQLADECGALFSMYAKKLLVRGWAGVMSPVERAYVREHRSPAEKRRTAALSARMKGRTPGRLHGTQKASAA